MKYVAKNRAYTVSAVLLIGLLVLAACQAVPAMEAPPAKDKKAGAAGGGVSDTSRPASDYRAITGGAFLAPCIVARPTDRSVVVSVVPGEEVLAYVEYRAEGSQQVLRTETALLGGGKPHEIPIEGLEKDTRYYYGLMYKSASDTDFKPADSGTFMTQRSEGSTFTFGVQGDSHPERPQQFDPALYMRTMQNAREYDPDFYLTSGDDFSIEKLGKITQEGVEGLYLEQRRYLGVIGNSSPLFIVNGNHENTARYLIDGRADNPAVWGQNARNAYFPQPAPDAFYSGDPEYVEHIGLLRDYFAFTWGDALFIVIDYYWHSMIPVDTSLAGGDKNGDPWLKTIDDNQYAWLKKTLEESTSKYKFVFTHHVLGFGRGGTDLASLYEWGGYGKNGKWEFAEKRPGWEMPIHELMAENGVTIFFQGHDHVFVRQELDGVTYQTLPLPADPYRTLYFASAYEAETKLAGPGHVRVTVAPDAVTLDYIASRIDSMSGEIMNDEVVHSYTLFAKE